MDLFVLKPLDFFRIATWVECYQYAYMSLYVDLSQAVLTSLKFPLKN